MKGKTVTAALVYSFVLVCAGALWPQNFIGTPRGSVVMEEEGRNDGGGSLTIETYPDYAEIYLDLAFLGRGTQTVDDIDPGLHRLTVRKKGYYPSDFWFTYTQETDLTLTVTLQIVTGYLMVSTVPGDAEIVVGKTEVSQGVAELPTGAYSVTVRSFGYEDYETIVEIEELATTTLSVELTPAEFSVKDFSASRERFNPGNPGKLGVTGIRFTVSSWGSGEISIVDQEGKEVWTRRFEGFSTWNQEADWNGRDVDGTILPDGRYTVTLHASGGNSEVFDSLQVSIDRSASIDSRVLWHGFSGLLFTPAAGTLQRGSFQVSSMVSLAAERTTGAYPLFLSGRCGISDIVEMDAWGALLIEAEDTDIKPGAGISAKVRLVDSPWFTGAALIGLSWWDNKEADPFTSYPGLTAAAAAEIGPAFLRLFLSPQVTVSLWDPAGSSDQAAGTEILSWGYFRAGIAAEAGPLWFGLSGAVRTSTFGSSFGIESPLETGAEIHCLVPGTQIVLSVFALCSWSLDGNGQSAQPEAFSMGLGIGFLD